MNKHVSHFVFLWTGVAVFIAALILTSVPASVYAGPTYQEGTPSIGDGGEGKPGAPTPTPSVRSTPVPGAEGGLPPSLNDLIVANPELKPYLDKVGKLTKDKIDLAEFYATLIKIYAKSGASGVGVFLQESGLLDVLGIPVDYLALMTAYDKDGKGNIDEVIKQARELKLVNDKDEFVGLLTLDDAKNLDSVKKVLTTERISVYEFNDKLLTLRIGIPVKVLKEFQTPASLIAFLIDIPSIPHVVGFKVPKPARETN